MFFKLFLGISLCIYCILSPCYGEKSNQDTIEINHTPAYQSYQRSLQSPIYTHYDYWKYQGDAIPTNNSVVIIPTVTDSIGRLWNLVPTKLNNVVITFKIVVEYDNSANNIPLNEGFAFWLLFTKPVELNESRLNKTRSYQYGYVNDYKGIGVFVSFYDTNNNYNPNIFITRKEENYLNSVLVNTLTTEPFFFNLIKSSITLKIEIKNSKAEFFFVNSTEVKLIATIPELGVEQVYFGFTAQNLNLNSKAESNSSLSRIAISYLKFFDIGIENYKINTLHLDTKHSAIPNLHNIFLISDIIEHKIPDHYNIIANSLYRLASVAEHDNNKILRLLKNLNENISKSQVDLMRLALNNVDTSRTDLTKQQNEFIQSLFNKIDTINNLVNTNVKSSSIVAEKLSHISQNQSSSNTQPHLETIQKSLRFQAKMGWIMFFFILITLISAAILIWKKTLDIEKMHLL